MIAPVPPPMALAAFVASAVLTLWSVQRAVVLDRFSTATVSAAVTKQTAAGAERPLASAELEKAVGKDPFHPQRRRPGVRFQLPGERAAPSDTATQAAAPFKLIGTASMPEGRGFAMCQAGADPPKIVRIGERFGDLTLKTVQPGKAVFLTGGGKRFEILVPKAGS